MMRVPTGVLIAVGEYSCAINRIGDIYIYIPDYITPTNFVPSNASKLGERYFYENSQHRSPT